MFDLAIKYCFHLDKDIDKDQEIFLLLLSLEKYVNGAILEINRLEQTRQNIKRGISNLRKNNLLRRKKDFQLTRLACDTHFFFICIDKCYKLITQLSLELNDQRIKILRSQLNKIFDIVTVRNHLEHIEDRCVGYRSEGNKKKKIKKHINDFGNFIGDEFSFDNKKFPSGKKSLEELKTIYKDLIKIIDEIARKDLRFVEKINAELRYKTIMKALKKAGFVK